MGSLWGAFLAALILGFLDNAGKYLWPEGGGFFIYVVTVVLLLARPDGLLARSRGA
jgi:branched-chain amino acid transport system permease protein